MTEEEYIEKGEREVLSIFTQILGEENAKQFVEEMKNDPRFKDRYEKMVQNTIAMLKYDKEQLTKYQEEIVNKDLSLGYILIYLFFIIAGIASFYSGFKFLINYIQN
jgi:hypothetical protein